MAQFNSVFSDLFSCQNYPVVTSQNLTPTYPLTKGELNVHIAKHLSGEVRMGLATPTKTCCVNWAMISIDENNFPSERERRSATSLIGQALSSNGISSYVERNKCLGEGSYQVWIFFKTETIAGLAFESISGLLSSLDIDYDCSVVPHTSRQFGHLPKIAWLPLFGGKEDTIERRRGGGLPSGNTAFLNEDFSIVPDQQKFIATINKVSESAFESLELATLPYQCDWQDERAGYAGGQDELQVVLDKCPFVNWCIEKGEAIPTPLQDALISNLCRFVQYGSLKIIEILNLVALKSRNQKALRAISSKTSRMFKAAGPLSYEAIVKLGWHGEIPAWPASPAGWGLYLDLERLAKEFTALSASPRRLDHALTKHFQQDFYRLPHAKRAEWLKQLSEITLIPLPDLVTRAKDSFERIELAGWNLGALLDCSLEFKYSPEQQGNLMYRWLLANGGKVFVDQHDTHYLAYRGRDAVLGEGKAFESILYDETGKTLLTPKIKRIVKAFEAEAYQKALKVDQVCWIHSDAAATTVHLHLNTSGKGIVRLRPGKVSQVPNATNDADVFLARCPKMAEWDLQTLSEHDYEKGLQTFDNLVLKNMACTRADQLLFGCWTLCYPLFGFVISRPHLRAEGISGSGKTRAVDLISHFVYGKSQLKTPTEAANIADASMNPFVFLDNIETRDLNRAMQNFILWAVSGNQKEKRKAGSASDIIQEELRCLVNTTGIESLIKTELINRTIHIEFEKSLQAPGGLAKNVYEEIKKQRSYLMSVNMMLASRLLSRIANGELKTQVNQISTKHPDFILQRSNDYIALMIMAAEELMPFVEPKIKAHKLATTWIEKQNKYATETLSSSNNLVGIVEAIFSDKHRHDTLVKPGRWPYELQCDKHNLQGSASEFHRTFLRAKGRHKLPYEINTASTLARRLKDSADALQSAGYDLTCKLDRHHKHLVFKITKL